MQSDGEVVSLLSTLKHNIQETMRPSEELFEINKLLDNLRVYAKRVEGLPLSEEDYRIASHKLFAGLGLPPRERVYNSLFRRLKVILRFNITSYEKITRDLLYGLVLDEVDRITAREIRLLSLLYQRPNTPQTTMAKELGISLPTLRKDIHVLEEKIGLRFANLIDWGRFKLRHYGLFFITNGVDSSQRLQQIFRHDMSTYLTSAVFDTTFQRGFAGFRIPDQGKPIQLFQEQLQSLTENFFEVSQIHEIRQYYQSICFDHFDYDTSTWLIEGDVTSLGLLNFVRENWNILPKPRGLSNTLARPFDKLDYFLASFLVGDGRAPMKKIQQRLTAFGIDVPRTTVSTRKNRLIKERTMEPYFVFSTPQLPFFITFAIECEPHFAEQFVVAVAQMPLAFASVSNIGCVVNVSVPSRSLGSILNLLSLTRDGDGVREVWQLQQFKNIGSTDPAQLADKWNGSYWNWSEEEFSIPSLGLVY
ncbi:MAG: helix-turn-helix domain-containing protein [Candidatus Thorarchaeota archaeon]